jgi:hypothetical protein
MSGSRERARPSRATDSRPGPGWKSVPAKTPAQYIAALPADRRAVLNRLRAALRAHLPPGFKETVDDGMVCWVVPHSLYPAGYHVDPSRGLPFMALASQKQYVSLYHMGLYGGSLLAWFKSEWPRRTGARLDLGKSCLRLRNLDAVPYDLIAELASKLTPRQWIAQYEAALGNRSSTGKERRA